MADRVRYATTCGAIYCKNRNGATLKTLALGPRFPPISLWSGAVVRAGLVTTRLALSAKNA
jgi:hypothetical protein